MNTLLEQSVFFGVFISFAAYGVGTLLRSRFRFAFLNPLLIAVILTAAFLIVCRIDYAVYYASAKYISFLLTPATVSLAIPLYEQFEVLKHNFKAIFAGILAGVLTSLCSILAMSVLFGFDHAQYVTFLPKSITTAIGMGVSEELGGYVSLTAAVIILTGVLGSILAEAVLKLFRITDPVAQGVAIGTSAHAVGTSKAMEINKTAGAMSGLSIVVAGILTMVGASVFAHFH